MIPGVSLTFGDKTYVVPPLSLGSLELLQGRLLKFQGDLTDTAVVVDGLLAALNRNYPELTRADVAEMVDVGNFVEVMEAIMDVGGMKRKAQSLGEATAV